MNTKRFHLIGIFGLTYLLSIFLSCSRQENTQTFSLTEKKVPCDISCQESITDTANILPLHMVNDIIRSLKNFKGTGFKLPTTIPDTWIAEYKLEAFSDFDIWIISNAGEPTFKILATVSSDTSTIIQAIPIAYNTAKEKPQYIESEYWQCHIDDIYNITVSKEYEMLHSLTEDSTADHSNLHYKTEDQYIIEADGTISYIEKPSFNIDYKAVILFADTSHIDLNNNETWLWNAISMHEHLEPVNIIFQECYNQFDKISVKNYTGEEVDMLNISEEVNRHHIGYIIVTNETEPEYIPYDSPQNILRNIMQILNMDIPEEWELDYTPQN
ncbi:MAG: hypothetical protein J6Y47_08740 [Bacteroidales bacterium]|nr:hypothetical protein [Bacteroidales bacterium]